MEQASDNILANRPISPLAPPTSGFTDTQLAAGADRLNVNMPVIGASGSIAFAILSGGNLLDLELSARQAENNSEIVASPRVVTADRNEAFIESGVEIPYETASSSGATTISFKKAVLSIKVKPQITPDDRIIMDLAVNKDAVGEVYAGIPSIDTREVQTQVLVNNGDTVKIFNVTHPQTSGPGYAMFYIWAIRHLDGNPYGAKFGTPFFDPEHSWVMKKENDDKIWPSPAKSKK